MLAALSQGDLAASSNLMPLMYDELRKLAAHYLNGERQNHSWQPTDLAHEAYLRLINQKRADWRNKAHFMGVAAELIRRILVDHARARHAAKRGGANQPVALDDDSPLVVHAGADLLALDEALTQLGHCSERQRRVVELRFFGGLTVEETAHVMDLSPATVKDDWRLARAWLRHRLQS